MFNNTYASGDFVELHATHCCGAVVLQGIAYEMTESWRDEDCEASWLAYQPEAIVMDIVWALLLKGMLSLNKNIITMYDVCPVGRVHLCKECEDEEMESGYLASYCDECDYGSPEGKNWWGGGDALKKLVDEADGELGSMTLSDWVKNGNSGNYIRAVTWILEDSTALYWWAMKRYPEAVANMKERIGHDWGWST